MSTSSVPHTRSPAASAAVAPGEQYARHPFLPFLPAVLTLLPFLLSTAVWLIPPNGTGLSGFTTRAPVNTQGTALILLWLVTICVASGVALAAGTRHEPLPSLRRVSVDGFHRATCIAGAIGTLWVYWTVVGGSLSGLVHLWESREFYRFREFDYGIGISTLRYGGVIAGGLSLARVASGARVRRLDAASLLVLVLMVLMNSRLSALMAVTVAALVIGLGPRPTKVRLKRIVAALIGLLILFVVANYSRNANNYERVGISNPVTMAAVNAQSYLATPAQVTMLVSEGAMDERLLPPTDLAHAWAPILPLYLGKRIYPRIQADPEPVEARYDGVVDLTLNLTTNGALTDILSVSGWWALASAILTMTGAAWVAGRFAVSGPIGAAIAGAVLYGFAEIWRVYIFNTGNVHFIVLMGVVAMAIGHLRGEPRRRSAAE